MTTPAGELKGVNELITVLEHLKGTIDTDYLRKVQLDNAKGLRKIMRSKINSRSGTLKRALQAKNFKKKNNLSDIAYNKIIDQAYVKVKYKGKRGTAAPYAHLVEYGHDIVSGGEKPRAQNNYQGTGKVTGWVRPRPFFRPAILDYNSIIQARWEKGLRKQIEMTVDKYGDSKAR